MSYQDRIAKQQDKARDRVRRQERDRKQRVREHKPHACPLEGRVS